MAAYIHSGTTVRALRAEGLMYVGAKENIRWFPIYDMNKTHLPAVNFHMFHSVRILHSVNKSFVLVGTRCSEKCQTRFAII